MHPVTLKVIFDGQTGNACRRHCPGYPPIRLDLGVWSCAQADVSDPQGFGFELVLDPQKNNLEKKKSANNVSVMIIDNFLDQIA